MKEKILVVDDTAVLGTELCKALEQEGHETIYVGNPDKFAEILASETEIGMGIFDIRLVDQDDEDESGILLARQFNKQRPRPTIFITNYDQSYKSKTEVVPHSVYCPRQGEQWTLNVIRSIEPAKDLFRFRFPQERIVRDTITFSSSYGDRVFLAKDEIICISTKTGKGENGVRFHLVSKEPIDFGNNSLSSVERQLKNYQQYGWCFIRVNQSLIVNMEKAKAFVTGYLKLKGYGPAPEDPWFAEKGYVKATMLADGDFSQWFPHLVIRE